MSKTPQEASPSDVAQTMQLRYVNANRPGFSRKKKGKKFLYLDPAGEEIKEPDILKRIEGLVLPPAWSQVWICPFPNGHLQATGLDVKGRKQYRYHARWSKKRNEGKFDELYNFGSKLSLLRKQITKDIRKAFMVKEKVVAIAIGIMDETYIRAGNNAYEKQYGSYGLTTLKNRHVNIEGAKAFFKFRGKKGVMQQITLKNRSLAKLLKNVKELPGQELFQYYGEDHAIKQLDSGDINDYIKDAMGAEFTCKDFRTWAGCITALQLMTEQDDFETDAECKRCQVAILDGVAEKLGNTRTVTKKYYVHPELMDCYAGKKLEKILSSIKKRQGDKEFYKATEKAFLAFLKSRK